MTAPSQKSRFEFTGGLLCLDFTNTVNARKSDSPEDLLTDYGDLLRWAGEAGVISNEISSCLELIAHKNAEEADLVLHQAVELREATYGVFVAIFEHREMPQALLAIVDRAARRASENSRIVQDGMFFKWEWTNPESNLDSVLWPIARSAADLLVSTELSYVRRCASDDCAWLFLDKTKNHGRRWCEMRVCGNRDKARRYYLRNKKHQKTAE
ncbi:MAG: ABATE domain-containing protein [Terriglobales bacterium]